MTASPLQADDVHALLASLELLHDELGADDGLTATVAAQYRLQGASIALRAVLGDLPVESFVARIAGKHDSG